MVDNKGQIRKAAFSDIVVGIFHQVGVVERGIRIDFGDKKTVKNHNGNYSQEIFYQIYLPEVGSDKKVVKRN